MPARRVEEQHGLLVRSVVADAVSQAPDNVMPIANPNVVLGINVVHISHFVDLARDEPGTPVVVGLYTQIGAVSKTMGPARKKITAMHTNIGPIQNTLIPGIEIPL